EREFHPLRWAVGRDGDAPFVRLIDNTAGDRVDLQLYEFARPDRGLPVELDSKDRAFRPSGGLVSASTDGIGATVILPPRVRTLSDLHDLDVHPALSDAPRSPQNT